MGSQAARGDRRALPLAMRILLGVGFGLALAATALVVFADNVKLLRLAAVLALWVALIAAFAIARSRRDTRAAERRQEEIRLAYEIELHREVAARTEYEASLGRQLEAAQADQLDALRGEIDRLASALSRLLDGDVLIERVTLSAESTRVRALGDAGSGRLAAGSVAALQVGESDRGVSRDQPTFDVGVLDGLDHPVEIVGGESGRTGDDSADEDLAAEFLLVGDPVSDADHAVVAEDDTGENVGAAAGDLEPAVDDEIPSDVPADVDWTADAEPGADLGPDADVESVADNANPAAGSLAAQGFPGRQGEFVPHDDEHPTLPLPTVQRSDAPATGWTWSHRASSPVPSSAPLRPAVPVGAAVIAVTTLTDSAEPTDSPAALSDRAVGGPLDQPGEADLPPAPADVQGSPEPVQASGSQVEPIEGEDADDHAVAIGDLLAAYGLDGGSRRRRRRD